MLEILSKMKVGYKGMVFYSHIENLVENLISEIKVVYEKIVFHFEGVFFISGKIKNWDVLKKSYENSDYMVIVYNDFVYID